LKNDKKTIAIFTLVEHKEINGQFYGYAPYIREMNMWISHFDKVIVVGPYKASKQIDKIDLNYIHPNINLVKVPAFNIKSVFSIIRLLLHLPLIMYKMASVMKNSDYLHFRCPSNVAAVAAVVQVFFPSKPKSAKYAGNWDPNSSQPLGYRFQKWLLSHTFLSKNIKVLVYGEWKNQCLPWMLDNGNRGILIQPNINAVQVILNEISKGEDYLNTMSKNAQNWSQYYTVNRLEQEINKVVVG